MNIKDRFARTSILLELGKSAGLAGPHRLKTDIDGGVTGTTSFHRIQEAFWDNFLPQGIDND